MTPRKPPTQIAHPLRAVLRTVAAVVVAIVPAIPEIVTGAHLGSTAIGIQTVAIAGGITRLLASPKVEALLKCFAPWLATEPA